MQAFRFSSRSVYPYRSAAYLRSEAFENAKRQTRPQIILLEGFVVWRSPFSIFDMHPDDLHVCHHRYHRDFIDVIRPGFKERACGQSAWGEGLITRVMFHVVFVCVASTTVHHVVASTTVHNVISTDQYQGFSSSRYYPCMADNKDLAMFPTRIFSTTMFLQLNGHPRNFSFLITSGTCVTIVAPGRVIAFCWYTREPNPYDSFTSQPKVTAVTSTP